MVRSDVPSIWAAVVTSMVFVSLKLDSLGQGRQVRYLDFKLDCDACQGNGRSDSHFLLYFLLHWFFYYFFFIVFWRASKQGCKLIAE